MPFVHRELCGIIFTPYALPRRCEGKDLLPYLKGQKNDDVHEYLFWHNADLTDAKRRNLYAVRWKNWRLVKYPDDWRLFDLKDDPQETKNLANDHPQVVSNMRKHYDAFVATLPPLKRSADYKGGGKVESGWGWVMGNGR